MKKMTLNTVETPNAASRENLGITKFDLSEYLDSPKTIAAYMSQVLADGDVEELKRALAYVAKAQGMTQVAESAGLNRVSLYKALTPGTQMRAETMLNVLKAVGVELQAKPVKRGTHTGLHARDAVPA